MRDHPTWRRLGWAIAAIQAAAFSIVLVQQGMGEAWTIAVFLIFALLALLARQALPGALAFLVSLIGLIESVGTGWQLYETVWWYDVVGHTFSGFAITAAAAYLLLRYGWIGKGASRPGFALQCAAVGLAIGIAWECAEFLFIDITVPDTIGDLACDGVGALAAALFLAAFFMEKPPAPAGR